MSQVNSIIKDVAEGNIKPIYLLMGDEPYFIDRISGYFAKNLLDESEKFFDQHIYYGKDTSVDNLLARLRSYPMMSKYQLVVLREAQQLPGSIDKLEAYAQNPVPTTIFVICHKYKSVDKRKKVYKAINEKGLIFESKRLYENQLPPWIRDLVEQQGKSIAPDSIQMICDSMGTNLGLIEKEIEKLCSVIPDKEAISPEHIHTYTGISKDFNNFELQKAIAKGNFAKALQIVEYFSKNPNKNPLVLTISVLFDFFKKILIYHGLVDKYRANVVRSLSISPYFADEYSKAAQHYPMKRVSAIINSIKALDLKSKGIGVAPTSQGDLLKEMLFNIFLKN